MATNTNSSNQNSSTPLSIVQGGTAQSSVTSTPTAGSWAGWDGASNLAANNIFLSFTTTATAAGLTALTSTSTYYQFFTGTSTQTVKLQNTFSQGNSLFIVNLSTGNVTVNAINTQLLILSPGSSVLVTALVTTPGTTSGWGTQIFQNTTSGTSGYVLTANASGTSPTWQAATSTGGVNKVIIQTFTSSGTYTPSAGLFYAQIEVVGGGGAGGGTAGVGGDNTAAGGGGGAGGYGKGVFSAATIGASQSVTIGAAASGSSGAAGGNGNACSVGALISANGGSGGASMGSSSGQGQSAAGGAGGTVGSGGSINAVGQPGGMGVLGYNTTATGGFGGSTLWGGGGKTQTASATNITGAAGTANSGSGGAGASCYTTSSATNSTGGAGGTGYVVITEYTS